jgi:hypothetical protein
VNGGEDQIPVVRRTADGIGGANCARLKKVEEFPAALEPEAFVGGESLFFEIPRSKIASSLAASATL